jgi:hypothetical protein
MVSSPCASAAEWAPLACSKSFNRTQKTRSSLMSAIGVIATLTVAEGKNEDFEAVFAELAAAVRA